MCDTIFDFFSKPEYAQAKSRLAPLLVMFEKYISETFQSSLQADEGYFNFDKFYSIYPDLVDLSHEEIDKQLRFIGLLRNKTIHSWSKFLLPEKLNIGETTMSEIGNFIKVSDPFYVNGTLTIYGMLNLTLSLFPNALIHDFSISKSGSLIKLVSKFFPKDMVATKYASYLTRKDNSSSCYQYQLVDEKGKKLLLWILFKEKAGLVKEEGRSCVLDLGDYLGSDLHNGDPYNGRCDFLITETDDEYSLTIKKGSYLLNIYQDDFELIFAKNCLFQTASLFSAFACFETIIYCRKKGIKRVDQAIIDSLSGTLVFESDSKLWNKVFIASNRTVSTSYDIIDHFACPLISFFVWLENFMAKHSNNVLEINSTFAKVLKTFCPSLPDEAFSKLVSCRNASCHGFLANESCSNGYDMSPSNVILSIKGFLNYVKSSMEARLYAPIGNAYAALVATLLSNKYLRVLELTVQVLFDKNGKEKEEKRKATLQKLASAIEDGQTYLTFEDESNIDLSIFPEPLHLFLDKTKVLRLGVEKTHYQFTEFFLYRVEDSNEYYFYTEPLFKRCFADKYLVSSKTKKGLCNIIALSLKR